MYDMSTLSVHKALTLSGELAKIRLSSAGLGYDHKTIRKNRGVEGGWEEPKH